MTDTLNIDEGKNEETFDALPGVTSLLAELQKLKAENKRYREALELWQTFDARKHNALIAAQLHLNGVKALSYNETGKS
jgi:cell shape-determining protein MreC